VYDTIPDSVNIRKEKDFNQEMALALEFINDDFFGIEIDLDSNIAVVQ
jgi:formiminoglutamase